MYSGCSDTWVGVVEAPVLTDCAGEHGRGTSTLIYRNFMKVLSDPKQVATGKQNNSYSFLFSKCSSIWSAFLFVLNHSAMQAL